MMANQAPVPANNGMLDDDTFERDLKEMLEDGPALNDMSSPVQGGNVTAQNKPAMNNPPPIYRAQDDSAHLPTRLPQSDIPRSQSMNIPPVSRDIPLSGSQTNGAGANGDFNPKQPLTQQAASKIDLLKTWSINTYKCTKQMLSERLGKGSRTVDLELEAQIEVLRDTQKKYANILRLARALTNHFYHVVQTQRGLGEAFTELSQKSPELQDEFTYNAETQKNLTKNGETLLGAMNFFTSTVNTLCNKTMEDTLSTVKQYEQARLEYDAYRTDVEALNLGPRDSTNIPKIEEANKKFAGCKSKFDRLREDVSVKLKFLEENKVKVMHKQLLLFHNAIAAYFSGNQTALEETLKQFNIKLRGGNMDGPSWIEQ
ncbi:unnamed protein product [Owenia fusiformis]|uniref:AH domain-containing protein n=1 Tax=Owenia fusiformis TaxID=6347 RepID=A0A8S4N7R7_OWEFU|nr:unnamed protein product [Owenia fusiformis]